MQTSGTDFAAACAAPLGALATQFGDGEVRLAGAFAETFDGPALDSGRWLWGDWNGGNSYTPNPGGTLQLSGANGAWARSQSTLMRQTIEGLVAFGAAPWQHFGLGSDGFQSSQYLLFSTFNTSDHVFARSNNNGSEICTDLVLFRPASTSTGSNGWRRTSGAMS